MSGIELRKARRALDTARVDLNAGDSAASINRSYYAMYYAARAMMINAGAAVPKTHSTLIGEFSRRFRNPDFCLIAPNKMPPHPSLSPKQSLGERVPKAGEGEVCFILIGALSISDGISTKSKSSAASLITSPMKTFLWMWHPNY